MHSYVAVPWAKMTLWACGIKVRAIGQENISPQLSRIYMTNHQSYFDIFALLAYLHVHFKFILKEELMRIPLFGITMRKAGYIGVERDDPRKAIQSLNRANETLKGGASVVIFPEGTRSADGRLQPFKRGGFKLALKSGCEIVPVTIRDSYRIVPKGSLRINKGSFDICFGKPISVKAYTNKDIPRLMEAVREGISNQMGNGDDV
ncbi:MAG: lysophospholipid acyltransferase family protein [Pseudomonadota bacterium]